MSRGLEAIAFAIVVCALAYCTVHSDDNHQRMVAACVQGGGNWSGWNNSCDRSQVKP